MGSRAAPGALAGTSLVFGAGELFCTGQPKEGTLRLPKDLVIPKQTQSARRGKGEGPGGRGPQDGKCTSRGGLTGMAPGLSERSREAEDLSMERAACRMLFILSVVLDL